MNKKISKILFIMFAIIMMGTNVFATPGEWFPQESYVSDTITLEKVSVILMIVAIFLILIVTNIMIIILAIKQHYQAIKSSSECRRITKIYLIFIMFMYICPMIMSNVTLNYEIKELVDFIYFMDIIIILLFPIITYIVIRKQKDDELWNYISY